MSHTNVDSKRVYHIANSTITYIDEKEKKIEDPAGGINQKGRNVETDYIEISLNPEYRLKDDEGRVIYSSDSLENLKLKEKELKEKGTKNASTRSSRNEDVTK